MLCTGHANVVFGFKNCQSHAIRLEQRLFPMNPIENSKQNQHDAQPTENGKIKLILNSGMASVVMQPCKIDSWNWTFFGFLRKFLRKCPILGGYFLSGVKILIFLEKLAIDIDPILFAM